MLRPLAKLAYLTLSAFLLSNIVWADSYFNNAQLDQRLQRVESYIHGRATFQVDSTAKASGAVVTLTGDFHVPAETIIDRAYLYVDDAFTSASSNTVSIKCSATGDIVAATNLAAVSLNGLVAGVPVETTPTMVFTSGGCDLKAVIGSGTTGISDGRAFIMWSGRNTRIPRARVRQ